ncbi:MAG TPA: hypothetical protein VGA13_12930 [Acidimicrobiales bacterium]
MADGELRGATALTAAIAALLTTAAALIVDDLVGLPDVPGLDLVPGVSDDTTVIRAFDRDADVYRGFGAWIDAFDYGPAYQPAGRRPPVDASTIDVLAARGIRTIYLQVTRIDDRSPGGFVDEAIAGDLLRRAHEHEMRVVGWFLPKHLDTEADLGHLLQIHRFRTLDGHRFDGIAVDIEDNFDEPDPAVRSIRLLELSRRLRATVGIDALGAIVVPPVLMEQVNPDFWPGFPWADLAEIYDAWLPMAYWTFRDADSGLRNPATYTTVTVERLRQLVGADVLIHVVGGVADRTAAPDYTSFVGASTALAVEGMSTYDAVTTDEAEWAELRRWSPPAPPADQP